MADIKVYSTPTCPWCKKVKELLDEKGVEYEDINAAEEQDEFGKVVEKSGQMGVPQTVIGDNVIVGFDKEAIEKALDAQS
jgi:glutaredoxin-like YruB-family protein